MTQQAAPVAPIAMVTGAARRLGAVIAAEFWRAGYDLALHCRNSAKEAEELRRQLLDQRQGRIELLRGDLALPEECERVGAEFCAAFPRLDCLVHSASLYERDSWEGLDLQALQRSLAVHVAGPVALTRALTQRLREAGGNVILLTDAYAPGSRAHRVSYEIGKGALAEAVLPVLARALAPQVRVNAVAPGRVLPPEDEQPGPDTTPGGDTPPAGARRTPLLQGAGRPQDVAAACLFLCREAPHTTGQTLRVDGGAGRGA